jgi:hypothetical protein
MMVMRECPLLRNLLLAATLFATPAGAAKADSVTITATLLPDNTPMEARVTRRSAGNEGPLDDTDATGKLTFEEKNCSADTAYSADPDVNNSGVDYRKQWRVCRTGQPIAFYFYTRQFASKVAPILAATDGPYSGTVGAITAALDEGDLGTAALLSTEAAAALRAAGKGVDANAFAAFATVAGAGAVTASSPSTRVGVTFDPGQQQWAVSGPGEQALKTYQAAAKATPTGKLDWKTLRPLSPLPDEALFALKLNALSALK